MKIDHFAVSGMKLEEAKKNYLLNEKIMECYKSMGATCLSNKSVEARIGIAAFLLGAIVTFPLI